MKSNFGFCVLLLISVLLYSCATFRINNTSDFQKTENLSVLNGEYFSLSEITKKAKFQVNINNLFDAPKDHTDFFTITFEEPDKVTLSYWLMTEVGAIKKTVSFKGKRKKKFLQIYFSKKQFFIPLVYGMFDVKRIRIGQDKNGNLLIRRFYDSSGYIIGFAAGHSDETPYIFTKSDKYKEPKPFQENNKWGYLDSMNNIIISPQYEFAHIFHNNSARVKLNAKWGLISPNRNALTPVTYDSISLINTHVFPPVYFVEINKKLGIIDTLGREITPVLYDEINRSYSDIFELKLGDKYGVASREKLIAPAIYSKVDWFNTDGFMLVKKGEENYLIDKEGYEYDVLLPSKPTLSDLIFKQQTLYPLKPDLQTKRKITLGEQTE